jgi:hypothetical protein
MTAVNFSSPEVLVRVARPASRRVAVRPNWSIALRVAVGVSALACILPLAGVLIAGVASPVLVGYIAIICLLSVLALAALLIMDGVPVAAMWPATLVVPACVFAGVAALGSAAAVQEERVRLGAQEILVAACFPRDAEPDLASAASCVRSRSLVAVRTASKSRGSLVNHKKVAESIVKNL